MRFTTQQNLPCPEGSDMAAVALYMQCLAEQVEDTLVTQSASFTSFLDAPVAIWTAGTQTLSSTQDVAFTAVTSNNWPTVPVASAPSLPNLRGWYYIGANVNLVDATPAVDQDRALVLSAIQNTGVISGSGTLAQFEDIVLESNTGGENVLPAGTVFFAGGDFTSPNPVDLYLTYFQGVGLGNTVDVSATPQARLWVVYLGDTPQIGAI